MSSNLLGEFDSSAVRAETAADYRNSAVDENSLGELEKTILRLKDNLTDGQHVLAVHEALGVFPKIPDTATGDSLFTELRAVFLDAIFLLMVDKPVWSNEPERWTDPLKEFLIDHWAKNSDSFDWMKPVLRAKHKVYRQEFFIALHEVLAQQDEVNLDGYIFLMHGNMWDGAFELFEPIADAIFPEFQEKTKSNETRSALDWCVLGDTMLMIQRVEDAETCYREAIKDNNWRHRALLGLTAVKVDLGQINQAAVLAEKAAVLLENGKHAPLAKTIRAVTNLWQERQKNTQPQSIEVIIFCHCHQKLNKNIHLGPPGTGLMEAVVDSLEAHLGMPEGMKITIYYDHRETPLNDKYYENLKEYAEIRGFKLVKNVGNGLRKQWLHAFSEATSDLVLVVEQDHVFLEGCPTYNEVVTKFGERADINYLRISRQRLRNWGFDAQLHRSQRDEATGVSRLALFSNTPHYLRTDFYKNVILPIIEHNTTFEGRNLGAAGVEESVNQQILSSALTLGRISLMRIFGLVAWGRVGDKSLTSHTGF